jgi:hypothetical protein
MESSRAAWSARVAKEVFPGAAKSEGVFICVNNAKILCVEIERRNTFFKQKQKVQSLPGLCAVGQWLIFSWESAEKVF